MRTLAVRMEKGKRGMKERAVGGWMEEGGGWRVEAGDLPAFSATQEG